MTAKDYTPAMQELLAKNILLSRGGNIYPMPGQLTYEVLNHDGRLTERDVTSIHFTPGYCEKAGGYYVYFMNNMCPLTEPADRKKTFEFIIEHYKCPDKFVLEEKELINRLDIRMQNISYISEHGDIDEKDFAMIEDIRSRLAKARLFPDGKPAPVAGDLIEGAYYGGKFPFNGGVIESYSMSEDKLSVCAQPCTPWAHRRSGDAIHVTCSGGPFFSFLPEELEYIGKDTRLFEEWSHNGPCGNGAIRFSAEVNRWRVRPGVEF